MHDLLNAFEREIARGQFAQAQQRLESFQQTIASAPVDSQLLQLYQEKISRALTRCLRERAEISNEIGSAKRSKAGVKEYYRVVNLS